MTGVKTKRFINKFIDKFAADDTMTLAASVAFYAALSLAPFLILFVSLSALLNEELQRVLINEVGSIAGPDAARTVEIVVQGAKRQTELSSLAGWLALGALLFSASMFFGQLRWTLNRIFSVHLPHANNRSFFKTVWCFIEARLIDVGFSAIFLLILLGSVLLSTVGFAKLNAGEGWLPSVENAIISAVIYVVIFTLLFRFLPQQRVRWERAVQGGAITALLFVFGKELIAYYLGSSALASAYGAAGSLIALLAWVYYSSLIIFVGAQVSSLLKPLRSGTLASD